MGAEGTTVGQYGPPDSGINIAESRGLDVERNSHPVAGGRGCRTCVINMLRGSG